MAWPEAKGQATLYHAAESAEAPARPARQPPAKPATTPHRHYPRDKPDMVRKRDLRPPIDLRGRPIHPIQPSHVISISKYVASSDFFVNKLSMCLWAVEASWPMIDAKQLKE